MEQKTSRIRRDLDFDLHYWWLRSAVDNTSRYWWGHSNRSKCVGDVGYLGQVYRHIVNAKRYNVLFACVI